MRHPIAIDRQLNLVRAPVRVSDTRRRGSRAEVSGTRAEVSGTRYQVNALSSNSKC